MYSQISNLEKVSSLISRHLPLITVKVHSNHKELTKVFRYLKFYDLLSIIRQKLTTNKTCTMAYYWAVRRYGGAKLSCGSVVLWDGGKCEVQVFGGWLTLRRWDLCRKTRWYGGKCVEREGYWWKLTRRRWDYRKKTKLNWPKALVAEDLTNEACFCAWTSMPALFFRSMTDRCLPKWFNLLGQAEDMSLACIMKGDCPPRLIL